MLTEAIRKQAGRRHGTSSAGLWPAASAGRQVSFTGVRAIGQGAGVTAGHDEARAPAPGPRDRAAAGLAAAERAVLARWARDDVPARSLAAARGGPRWTCHEPPLEASGMPGIHLVPGIAVADLYHRLKVMQGFDVRRMAGWNWHGLGVEVAVEKELGLSGRRDIEAYGTERFTARCRESARRHAAAIDALRDRLACWPGDARGTADAEQVDAAWRPLRQLFEAGLLVRDRRAVPYCPRCETPLAAHDLRRAGARRPASWPAVVVRCRLSALADGANPRLHGADLLVRVSEPWTLPAGTAIAVHSHETYAIARRSGHDDRVIVAESRLADLLGEDWHVAARITGASLAGATWRPPLDGVEAADTRPVIARYLAPAREGTGLEYLAAGYGAGAGAAGLADGAAEPDPIGEDGRFDRRLPALAGVFFADSWPVLAALLTDRGLLVCAEQQRESYPHCWRCGTPLLRRAVPAWHLRTSAAADAVRAAGGEVRWKPPGAALRAITDTDWTLSRTRHWGTPLPVWECQSGHLTCAGSRAELSELAGADLADLDPHRPYIDAITITCPRCGTSAHRVPEVTDHAYDAAALALAVLANGDDPDPQETPVVVAGSERRVLVGETRERAEPWLGALLALGVLAGNGPAFDTALLLGDVRDEHGRPMSGGAGNLVEPLPLIEQYGADALRWLVTTAPAGTGVIASAAALEQIEVAVLRPCVAAAAALTAAAGGSQDAPGLPGGHAAPLPGARPLPDRWVLSELHAMVRDVTAALEDYDSAAAGHRISAFIDVLTLRYLPCSGGRRSGRDHPRAARRAALATLHECLDVLARVMAPITPFLADHIWALTAPWRPGGPDSVHLAPWPAADPALMDERLAGQAELASGLGGTGSAARA